MKKSNILKGILGGLAVVGGGVAIAKAFLGKNNNEEVQDSDVEAEEVYDEE